MVVLNSVRLRLGLAQFSELSVLCRWRVTLFLSVSYLVALLNSNLRRFTSCLSLTIGLRRLLVCRLTVTLSLLLQLVFILLTIRVVSR